MIAAVSAVIPAAVSRGTRAASTASTGWWFAPVPDLNREARQAIGKAKAGWTFTTICTELHQAGRKGTAASRQAAKAGQSLGIGLHAIARESGQSLGKVRRDVAALERLGLICTVRPNVLAVRDTSTGQITENSRGRCKATLIFLTITPAALRPAKAADGSKLEPSRAAASTSVAPSLPHDRVHPGTTVREGNIKETPDGGADGVGTPPAEPAGGLTAAKAPASLIPATAGRDSPAVPDRILPAPAPARRPPRQHGHRDPEAAPPWSDEAIDAFRRTRERLEAERLRREAEDAAAKALAPSMPPPADEAADRLREALVPIPYERRDLLRRDVERQADAEDPEAAALAAMIERRKAEDAERRKAENAAKAEVYRADYHRERATA